MAPGLRVRFGTAIQPLADPRRDRVVHGGVTQRAGDADAHQRVLAVPGDDRTLHAHDGVELEQGNGRGRALEIRPS
jgi:hypothetical protein